MDNLTHSLFGLMLARSTRAGRDATAALLIASNISDIDAVTLLDSSSRYLQFHRGPTHGPLGVIGLSCLVAGAVWLAWRGRHRESDRAASFVMLWGLSAIGILGHVLMDLATPYGTRLLSPFSWTWFTTDWMPIVDVYLLSILGASLWFGRGGTVEPVRSLRRKNSVLIAIGLMAAVYGLRATTHSTAIARAPVVFGNRLPAWCDRSVGSTGAIASWPRVSNSSAGATPAVRCLVEIAAMPDFISPFRWRLIAHLSDGYELRDVDLLRDSGLLSGADAVRTLSVHVPNQWTPAVMKAAVAPVARIFLGFSRFPAARSTSGNDRVTVRWTDVRFVRGSLMDPRSFRRSLFNATVVVASGGAIVSDRLGP